MSLPSLRSWVFYMVNPGIKPESFNGHNFKRGLEALDNTHHCQDFHYEFFFLPNASAEECVTHFRSEITARGTIWDQIREVAAAKAIQNLQDPGLEVSDDMAAVRLGADRKQEPYSDRVGEGQRLPGLLFPLEDPPYEIFDHMYRGGLFVYPHADVSWGGTDASAAREICLVNFDPIPIDEEERNGGTISFDPIDHPVHLQLLPAARPPNERKRELGGPYPEEGKSITLWMDRYAYSEFPPRLQARDATTDATDMGWQSW